jgi:hypothetical protein
MGTVLTVFGPGKAVQLAIASAGPELPIWRAGGLIGLVIAGLMWWQIGRPYSEREAVFDWSFHTLQLRDRGGSVELPFGQIEAIAVEGHRKRRQDRPDRYFCDIFAVSPDGDRRTVMSEGRTDADEVYRECAALAADLAEHFGVPWRWRGYSGNAGLKRLLKAA